MKPGFFVGHRSGRAPHQPAQPIPSRWCEEARRGDLTTLARTHSIHSIEATIGSRYDTEQEKHVPAEVRTIKMEPVYQGASGEENTHFWAATPSGTLELTCIHLEAASLNSGVVSSSRST